MKKNRLRVILVVLIALSTLIIASYIFGDVKHIEDTNGSDFSLCTLTEEDILAENTSSLSFALAKSQIGSQYRYSVKKMSGVVTLTEFKTHGERLTIHMDTTLEQGNLRIIVLCDGEFITDIPVSEDQTITIDEPSGNFEIRLAGESAEVKIVYSYNIK